MADTQTRAGYSVTLADESRSGLYSARAARLLLSQAPPTVQVNLSVRVALHGAPAVELHPPREVEGRYLAASVRMVLGTAKPIVHVPIVSRWVLHGADAIEVLPPGVRDGYQLAHTRTVVLGTDTPRIYAVSASITVVTGDDAVELLPPDTRREGVESIHTARYLLTSLYEYAAPRVLRYALVDYPNDPKTVRHIAAKTWLKTARADASWPSVPATMSITRNRMAVTLVGARATLPPPDKSWSFERASHLAHLTAQHQAGLDAMPQSRRFALRATMQVLRRTPLTAMPISAVDYKRAAMLAARRFFPPAPDQTRGPEHYKVVAQQALVSLTKAYEYISTLGVRGYAQQVLGRAALPSFIGSVHGSAMAVQVLAATTMPAPPAPSTDTAQVALQSIARVTDLFMPITPVDANAAAMQVLCASDLRGMPIKPEDATLATSLVLSGSDQTTLPISAEDTLFAAQLAVSGSALTRMPISAMDAAKLAQATLSAQPFTSLPMSPVQGVQVASMTVSARVMLGMPRSPVRDTQVAVHVAQHTTIPSAISPMSVHAYVQQIVRPTTFPTTRSLTRVRQVAMELVERTTLTPIADLRSTVYYRHAVALVGQARPTPAPDTVRSLTAVGSAALLWGQTTDAYPPPWLTIDPNATRVLWLLARHSLQRSAAGYPKPGDMSGAQQRVRQVLRTAASTAAYGDAHTVQARASVRQTTRVAAQVAKYPFRLESQPGWVRSLSCMVAQTVEYPNKDTLYADAVARQAASVIGQSVVYPGKDETRSDGRVQALNRTAVQAQPYPDKGESYTDYSVQSLAQQIAQGAPYRDKDEVQSPAVVVAVTVLAGQRRTYPDKGTNYTIAQVAALASLQARISAYPDKDTARSDAGVRMTVRLVSSLATYPDKAIVYSEARAQMAVRVVGTMTPYPDKGTAYSKAQVAMLLRTNARRVRYPHALTPYSAAVVNEVQLVYVQAKTEFDDNPFQPPRNRPIITARFLT